MNGESFSFILRFLLESPKTETNVKRGKKNLCLPKQGVRPCVDHKMAAQTLLQVVLGPSSEEHAMAELRPVRHQSGLTHSAA